MSLDNYSLSCGEVFLFPIHSAYAGRHLDKAKDSNTAWGSRFQHGMIWLVELLPVIGMVASIFEVVIVKANGSQSEISQPAPLVSPPSSLPPLSPPKNLSTPPKTTVVDLPSPNASTPPKKIVVQLPYKNNEVVVKKAEKAVESNPFGSPAQILLPAPKVRPADEEVPQAGQPFDMDKFVEKGYFPVLLDGTKKANTDKDADENKAKLALELSQKVGPKGLLDKYKARHAELISLGAAYKTAHDNYKLVDKPRGTTAATTLPPPPPPPGGKALAPAKSDALNPETEAEVKRIKLKAALETAKNNLEKMLLAGQNVPVKPNHDQLIRMGQIFLGKLQEEAKACKAQLEKAAAAKKEDIPRKETPKLDLSERAKTRLGALNGLKGLESTVHRLKKQQEEGAKLLENSKVIMGRMNKMVNNEAELARLNTQLEEKKKQIEELKVQYAADFQKMEATKAKHLKVLGCTEEQIGNIDEQINTIAQWDKAHPEPAILKKSSKK